MIENIDDIEIVLVEDNHFEAELTIRALKKSHLANKLIWLKDGEEARNFFLGEDCVVNDKNYAKPKLVLLDLNIPKINGIEVLELLKSNPITKNIPIVVMTSSNHEKDLNRCYELGVNSYIVKPVKYDAFSEICKQIGLYWTLTNRTIE
ncbi:response regulator [Reichenbachiella agarivorans]|uniref:Response regulator n=1 Tax=Reichenbachiella agarivorans TaxID=2979464 RepID=A0ABY6CNQ0_9BACT|nr:response regulator [Reichenbachiella agarivorans]UXP32112.1 response regulator [Reichenbachiella agarivorans]